MKNEFIITDFLSKYFKLNINEEGEWVIFNLMDKVMSIKDLLNEIYDVFGRYDDYKLILYNWVLESKKGLTEPVVGYLEYYNIELHKFGWSIIKLGTRNELFNYDDFYKLFEKDYSEIILSKILEDWLYEKKIPKSTIGNIENTEEYRFTNKFFKLIINREGWCIRDVLDNKINEVDILTILYSLYSTEFNSALVFNTWLKNSMKKMTKPILLFLDDYEVLNKGFDFKIVHKETKKDLIIEKEFIPHTNDFSLSIIRQTVIYWMNDY